MLYGKESSYEGEWWRGSRQVGGETGHHMGGGGMIPLQGWGRMVYGNGDYYEGEWEAGQRQVRSSSSAWLPDLGVVLWFLFFLCLCFLDAGSEREVFAGMHI